MDYLKISPDRETIQVSIGIAVQFIFPAVTTVGLLNATVSAESYFYKNYSENTV